MTRIAWPLLALLALTIVGGTLYWTQIRPTHVRAACQTEADDAFGAYLWSEYAIFKNVSGNWVTSSYSFVTKQREQHAAWIYRLDNARRQTDDTYPLCLRRHGLDS